MMPENHSSETSNSRSTGPAVIVEAHFFACGHGDTILLKLPGDKWVLVDCHLVHSDGTRDRFFEYAAELGIERLDCVILTHPDSDHCLGMDEVLRHFTKAGQKVQAFCDGGPTAQRVSDLFRNRPGHKAYRRVVDTVRELCASGHICTKKTLTKDSLAVAPKGFLRRVDLVPIAPDAKRSDKLFDDGVKKIAYGSRSRPDSNNLSVILILALKEAGSECNLLLAADADALTIKDALVRWGERAEDESRSAAIHALKVPHHGSAASHVRSICLAVPGGPTTRVAVVSAGDRRALPDRRVLKDFIEHGWHVLCTHPRKSRKIGTNVVLDLLNRQRPAPKELQDFDIVLRWTPTAGLSCAPPGAGVKAADLVNYEAAAEQVVMGDL
jgi:beta-lactamase superfamily II metal-dependent hydrolase